MPMLADKEQARREIGKMIDFYNGMRPHMSIGNRKPMDVYAGEMPGPNMWKKKGRVGTKENYGYLCTDEGTEREFAGMSSLLGRSEDR